MLRVRQVIVTTTLTGALMASASCTGGDREEQATAGTQAPQTTEVALIGQGAEAKLQVPASSPSGDVVRVPYTVTNTSSTAVSVVGGDCNGLVIVQATTPPRSRHTFRDGLEPGSCYDMQEVVEIEPGQVIRGLAEWRAGQFEFAQPLSNVDVTLTFRMTIMEDDGNTDVTASSPLRVE